MSKINSIVTKQLVSTYNSGAPMSVTSTTQVSNLKAQYAAGTTAVICSDTAWGGSYITTDTILTSSSNQSYACDFSTTKYVRLPTPTVGMQVYITNRGAASATIQYSDTTTLRTQAVGVAVLYMGIGTSATSWTQLGSS